MCPLLSTTARFCPREIGPPRRFHCGHFISESALIKSNPPSLLQHNLLPPVEFCGQKQPRLGLLRPEGACLGLLLSWRENRLGWIVGQQARKDGWIGWIGWMDGKIW